MVALPTQPSSGPTSFPTASDPGSSPTSWPPPGPRARTRSSPSCRPDGRTRRPPLRSSSRLVSPRASISSRPPRRPASSRRSPPQPPPPLRHCRPPPSLCLHSGVGPLGTTPLTLVRRRSPKSPPPCLAGYRRPPTVRGSRGRRLVDSPEQRRHHRHRPRSGSPRGRLRAASGPPTPARSFSRRCSLARPQPHRAPSSCSAPPCLSSTPRPPHLVLRDRRSNRLIHHRHDRLRTTLLILLLLPPGLRRRRTNRG